MRARARAVIADHNASETTSPSASQTNGRPMNGTSSVARASTSSPVIGVASDGVREDDDLWSEVPDLLDEDPPGCPGIRQVGIAKSRVAPLVYSHDRCRALGLLTPECGAPPRPRFAGGEIENAGPVSAVGRADEGAGAGQLDVVTMGGDGQQVDGHGCLRRSGSQADGGVARGARGARRQ